MILKTQNRFKDSTMVIKGNAIRWGDHMIQISNISQIWLGNCLKERLPIHLVLILFYIALSVVSTGKTIVMLLALIIYMLIWSYRYWKQKDTKDINFEVHSGNVYSFVSDNETFTRQVYDLICDLVSKKDINTNLCIHFKGDGNIVNNRILGEKSVKDRRIIEEKPVNNCITAKEKMIDKKILNIQSINTDDQLVIDLQKLALKYATNKVTNGEYIDLIENTIHIVDSNDKETLKKAFSKFIILGLIKDCNKLGLFTLIEAIRKNVYYN